MATTNTITRRPGPATLRVAAVELAHRAEVHFDRGDTPRARRAFRASRRLHRIATRAALRAA